MRVLFACGGTAGHINPAIAAARLIESRNKGARILFVGAERGMENQLVPREGYPLKTVKITRFQRSISLASLSYNLKTLHYLSTSRRQARAILEEFKPDLVVGTGGFASYPVVREAARRGIPTAIHESNAVPGLTTKMLSRSAGRVMVGFEESRVHYRHPDRVVVTGTPVRAEFFSRTRAEARAELGLWEDKPLVLSYFGSLGARDMNRIMAEFIRRESRDKPFYHMHAAGSGGFATMKDQIQKMGIDLVHIPEITLKEYIYNMAQVMAAADLVICRAGASTISELTALSKPAVLFPSPNVTGDHQVKNAGVLRQRGAAIVFSETDCSGDLLFEEVAGLLSHRERLRDMQKKAGAVSVPDAAERMYEVMMDLLRERRENPET